MYELGLYEYSSLPNSEYRYRQKRARIERLLADQRQAKAQL